MNRKNPPIDRLRDLSVFSGCSPVELQRVDSLTTYLTVEAGRVLARETTPGREFVVVVSGRASATRFGVLVARLGRGSFFGEAALFDRREQLVTVIADTEMELVVSSIREFRTMYFSIPAVARGLVESGAPDPGPTKAPEPGAPAAPDQARVPA